MTNPISEKELDEILDRCNSTTPGPWKSYVEGRDHESGSDFIMTGCEDNPGNDIELSGTKKAVDQDFIASAKQDIPKLVEEIRRLRGFTNE